MIPLQFISVIFGLFMLYIVRIHRRKRNLTSFETGVWIGIWGGFIYLAIFPQTFKGLIETLHIARVFDLLVIIALMIIVFFTFQNRVNYKKLDKKLEEIVRKRTLNQKNNKTKKH